MASLWSQLMLVCTDVEASSRFYCRVFGFESGHGGSEYDQLLHDGEMVMQLHDDDQEDHHGALRTAGVAPGNGVLVWFEVEDFEGTVERAKACGAEIVTDVHENTNAKQSEFWFLDPDGYLVVAAGPSDYRPRQSPCTAERFSAR